jgi:DNA-binding transcriptional LysR family regulator
MTVPTLDLAFLRSFVATVEHASLTRGAEAVSRSPAAVSAQLRSVSDSLGVPLFRKEGKVLVPTPAGRTLYARAQQLLALNDEVVRAIRGSEVSGKLRLGLQEDFGESVVPRVLGHFVAEHPKVDLFIRVARNAELAALVRSGDLDIALTWGAPPADLAAHRLAHVKMQWIGLASPGAAPARPRSGHDILRLALFDSPCVFHDAAVAALKRSGRKWHHVCASSGLGGLYAAVRVGLAVTVRTSLALPPDLACLSTRAFGLPPLPGIALSALTRKSDASPQVATLRQTLADAVQAL